MKIVKLSDVSKEAVPITATGLFTGTKVWRQSVTLARKTWSHLMHHWKAGGEIRIGWPDHGIPEAAYIIVECERMGQVFRARVTDGAKQGGFLVVFDCPDVALEILAGQATQALGFKVIVPVIITRRGDPDNVGRFTLSLPAG